MSRFPDCESCAFQDVETAVCEFCIDADQWEPSDPSEFGIITTSPKNVRIANFYAKNARKQRENH